MTPMPEPQIRPTASFLSYTPVPLAFGTSGLRGLVKDITDVESYINVKGALRYLLSTGDIRAGSRVVIGGDLRPSTDRIMRACAQAIVDYGLPGGERGQDPYTRVSLACHLHRTRRCDGDRQPHSIRS